MAKPRTRKTTKAAASRSSRLRTPPKAATKRPSAPARAATHKQRMAKIPLPAKPVQVPAPIATPNKPYTRSDLVQNIISAIILIGLFIGFTIILTVIVELLYSAGYISAADLNFAIEASLLAFFLSVFVYLVVVKQVKVADIPAELGFRLNGGGILSTIGIGVLVFILILVFELIIGVASQITGTQINTNVDVVFAGAPLWFYPFLAVIEPINEEIFFRGFLVPRIGIVPSAILFGIAHASYNSTFGIDIIAALLFGLVTGYVFKRTKSIYPGIIAHILVNTLAVIGLIYG